MLNVQAPMKWNEKDLELLLILVQCWAPIKLNEKRSGTSHILVQCWAPIKLNEKDLELLIFLFNVEHQWNEMKKIWYFSYSCSMLSTNKIKWKRYGTSHILVQCWAPMKWNKWNEKDLVLLLILVQCSSTNEIKRKDLVLLIKYLFLFNVQTTMKWNEKDLVLLLILVQCWAPIK